MDNTNVEFENAQHKKSETILFSNIGKKIKTLASVVAWLGIILCGVLGFFLTIATGRIEWLLIAAIGALISWISSFVLYGFGQLIENTDEIRKSLKK